MFEPNFDEVQKKCDICGSVENVEYFATSGCMEKDVGKIYLSGGVNLCIKCLDACEICTICNKLRPTKEVQRYIDEVMKHPSFCSQMFIHGKIAEIKKNHDIIKKKRG